MDFLKNNLKAIAIISGVIFTAIISGVVIATVVFDSDHTITVTLLDNAGVMIETEDTRIYIDPYNLPNSYSDYPADLICITHDHGDHYDPFSLDLIITENTTLLFPATMTIQVAEYGAEPVQPEDSFEFNDLNVNVTCFYMYTMPGSAQSSHPRSNNYTSFIIELEDFTIFHAGDSWNIEEYSQLTGEIDLALLPIGPGCQTMTGEDVVSAIETIEPKYMIPIHFTEDMQNTFVELYKADVEACGCKYINLDYFSSCGFS